MIWRNTVLLLSSVGLKTQPESKCPELLANYCDMLLRKTPLSKKLTSEEIEAKLKEVVCFCFLFLNYSEEWICFISLCGLRPWSSKAVTRGVIVEKRVYYVIVCVCLNIVNHSVFRVSCVSPQNWHTKLMPIWDGNLLQ